MPKKRKQPRHPTTGSRRAHSAGPVGQLASLRPEFLRWLDGPSGPDVPALAVWGDVSALLGVAADDLGQRSAVSWSPEGVEALVERAQERGLGDAVESLCPYFQFLDVSGRWRGTLQELDTIDVIVHGGQARGSLPLEPLAALPLDRAAQDAAVAGLLCVRDVRALLRWVAPRRPVTSTGALRRSELAPAAAAVGVDLGETTPRSMWDVRRLPDLWQGAVGAGLLDVGATFATVTAKGQAWLADTTHDTDDTKDLDDVRQASTAIAASFLQAAITRTTMPSLLASIETSLLVPVLTQAALGAPMSSDAVGRWLPAAVTAMVPPTDVAPVGVEALAAALEAWLQARLDALTQEGYLVADSAVRCAPGLEHLLGQACLTVLAAEAGVDAGALAGAEPGSGTAPASSTAPASGTTLRLRIDLEGTQPPVWREVLVDADTSLGQLHDVVQAVVGWDDDHMHRFVAQVPQGDQSSQGSRRGRATRGREVVYGPSKPAFSVDAMFAGMFGRSTATMDEDAAHVGQLLDRPGARISYEYDFGDSWEHDITLMAVEPDGPTPPGPLPRCVDGAGAAPHEDSGGVWGWAEKVRVAGDPSAPDHEEIREWLGLRPGEQLDLTAFDRGTAEAALRRVARTW